MSPDGLFAFFNVAVLPAWALLAVAPGWIWTRRLVNAVWIPFLLTAVYLYALVSAGPPPEGAGFSTLMAGPVGLSLYLAIRWVKTRSVSLQEEGDGRE
jgi:hypothetical protein